LDASDLDLSGVTPLPLRLAGNEMLLAMGKDGNAYLLNRANLRVSAERWRQCERHVA
jgi:hypothetical protein